jgi:hypothetical protein
MCIHILGGECGTWDQTTSAPDEYMANGHNIVCLHPQHILTFGKFLRKVALDWRKKLK